MKFPYLRVATTLATFGAFVALTEPRASACGSCRGPGGAGSAVTAPYETFGVTVAQTLFAFLQPRAYDGQRVIKRAIYRFGLTQQFGRRTITLEHFNQ